MEFNWLLAIGLFFAALALDAVFALYTVAIINTRPLAAANLSLLTYMLEAVGVVNYVNNRWYLIPLAGGAFFGSYIIVKRESNKAKNENKK
jgi:hypothetical protein